MQLNVRDVARLLDVPEAKVYRWMRDGQVPFHLVDSVHLFNREEILEWATAHGMCVSTELFARGAAPPRLADALAAGGVYHDVPGADPPAVLRSIVDAMRLPAALDREGLRESLVAREALGSTGVGEGIAIPHVHSPVVLRVPRPTLTLCFLTRPVDFAALDGSPVHTLFVIVTANARLHLQLLSRLSAALYDPGFRGAVRCRARADAILAEARRLDSTATTTATAATAAAVACADSDDHDARSSPGRSGPRS